MTAKAHACSRRDWNGVDSCGRARPTAPCRSRRRSSDTFCPASIGVIPRQPGVRPRLDEGSGLQTAVGMIPLPGDRCRRIASRRPCRCSCDDPRRAGGADRGTSRARAGSCGGGQRKGRSDEHGSAHRTPQARDREAAPGALRQPLGTQGPPSRTDGAAARRSRSGNDRGRTGGAAGIDPGGSTVRA